MVTERHFSTCDDVDMESVEVPGMYRKKNAKTLHCAPAMQTTKLIKHNKDAEY